jgi:hypothetical protein
MSKCSQCSGKLLRLCERRGDCVNQVLDRKQAQVREETARPRLKLFKKIDQQIKLSDKKNQHYTYMGGGQFEKRFGLPKNFVLSPWGGWVSPTGNFHACRSANDVSILSRNLTGSVKSKTSAAFTRAWVRVSYWQSYGRQEMDDSPWIRRVVTFSFLQGKLTPERADWISEIAKLYEDVYDNVSFVVAAFHEVGDTGLTALTDSTRWTSATFLGLFLKGAEDWE